MGDGNQQLASAPSVVRLDDPTGTDPDLTGSKAAALACAAAAGLPVLPGFVITTTPGAAADLKAVRTAWDELTDGGRRAVVVRSSSTTEDLEGSSMAGRYESVVDVEGWDRFEAAVRAVLESREMAAEGVDELTGSEPIAVLVQPMLHADAGGVMFGVDPVTGRTDRLVAVASSQGADAVVSGKVNGSRYVLDRSGDIVSVDDSPDGASLTPGNARALVQVVARAGEVFGGHQDIEWALCDDEVVLLQSRPVTTEVTGVPAGPIFGRGPVAETFPDALSPLEQDLWVPPLRDALREALLLSGAATEEQVDDTPLLVCVRGHVAVNIETTGDVAPAPSLGQRLDPRPRVRRLLGAWRIGRLRAALPGLAEDVVDRCDDALSQVPHLTDLTDRQLLAVLDRGSDALQSLHAHEVLMGQLVDPAAATLTGTSIALRVLAHARAAGTAEADIPRRHPVVLALTGPRIAPAPSLPADVEAPPREPERERDRDAVLREALRVRVRWVQELTARAAWELGVRLREQGVLGDEEQVRSLSIDELRVAVLERHVPAHGSATSTIDERPVPGRFRLTEAGAPVAVTRREGSGDGTGAGGGRGTGPVCHDVADAEEGSVLVVATLDPSLAPHLAKLSGLVAETGSVLAHIAILAREAGVPTVVGLTGAVAEFDAGSVVTVDGATGGVDAKERS